MICTTDSDCDAGTCSTYLDGDGTDSLGNPTGQPGYPTRGQPGIGPGGQVYQPHIAWDNKYCFSSEGCTPVKKVDIISQSIGSNVTLENRDFFNCVSEADCESRTGMTYQAYTYPH